MPRYLDEAQSHVSTDAKNRRKLLDQRRMEYRRAIEDYAEHRQLQQQLTDYPELIAANYMAAAQASARRSARPGR
ncbi:PA3496 family putative envelope integrity protein [Pseudomonas sp.]|uniref:PA3496 family putative envelope integrity protein n=1 Tax=Pseudomonas sp. TaxID=306 RepID=UPI002730808F|nr:transcriptional regulator [Pseudomonas sp.]MDP2243304.1 transcriptional regulator [Pseudomonas sp.]